MDLGGSGQIILLSMYVRDLNNRRRPDLNNTTLKYHPQRSTVF